MVKDLKTRRGRRQVQQWVLEGEHVRQDFKYQISDARKIARSISAFANNGGGQLLIGVKDNGVIAGVRNEEDVYVVETAAEIYCRPAQKVEFEAYSIDTGVTVIRALIPPASNRPVTVDEGSRGQIAYFRVADENIVAHRLMLAAWTNTAPLAMDSRVTAIVTSLSAAERGCTPEEIAREHHLSQRTTDAILTNLLAADILKITYCGNWLLQVNEPQ